MTETNEVAEACHYVNGTEDFFDGRAVTLSFCELPARRYCRLFGRWYCDKHAHGECCEVIAKL